MKKKEVAWTRPVGTETGANITKTDARTSEAVAQATSKQVVVASEPLQKKQDKEGTGARSSVAEPGRPPRHPNPLNRARERRRARLETEPRRPTGVQGEE